jgi:hypothetical protein
MFCNTWGLGRNSLNIGLRDLYLGLFESASQVTPGKMWNYINYVFHLLKVADIESFLIFFRAEFAAKHISII